MRISRELYRVGLASNTQVLEAVTLQIQATDNHDSAVPDEALAGVELAYAVGALWRLRHRHQARPCAWRGACH